MNDYRVELANGDVLWIEAHAFGWDSGFVCFYDRSNLFDGVKIVAAFNDHHIISIIDKTKKETPSNENKEVQS